VSSIADSDAQSQATMPSDRADRWQHLVAGAFRLSEAPAERAPAEARTLLHSVLEVFPETLDPVEDFEGYAVRRLAKSLLRVVEGAWID